MSITFLKVPDIIALQTSMFVLNSFTNILIIQLMNHCLLMSLTQEDTMILEFLSVELSMLRKVWVWGARGSGTAFHRTFKSLTSLKLFKVKYSIHYFKAMSTNYKHDSLYITHIYVQYVCMYMYVCMYVCMYMILDYVWKSCISGC